jgi:hypothetical protein
MFQEVAFGVAYDVFAAVANEVPRGLGTPDNPAGKGI